MSMEKSFMELFKQDVGRWIFPGNTFDSDQISWKILLKLVHRHLPLRAMLLFRFGSWCKHRKLPYFAGAMQRAIYSHYGLEIKPGADIGGGLYIPHPIGTVIMVNKIGQNCSIIANVTIGMRTKRAFPVIGDSVYIGAGARVLGGITVGDGAVIGANAVVIEDVPAGATVVGIPARVVRTKTIAESQDSVEPSQKNSPLEHHIPEKSIQSEE